MYPSRCALLAVVSVLGCRDAGGDTETRLRPAPVTPSSNAPQVAIDLGPHPGDDRVNPEQLAEDRRAGKTSSDKHKGDRKDEDWTPKEFTTGQARFKDTGVYVDGKPVGFLSFGELPIACKPSWLKDKVSADKRYGTDDPGWKWARKRYYKFTDYLRSLGVDVAKIKELHVYGPKGSQTLIVTGKDLRSPAASEFWFSFGSNTYGKALPHAAANFGNDRIGDKINGVMIYIAKKPPTLVEGDGLYLDGVLQTGVPYYGEPIRGGVRVYLDDKLATIIKRQELDPKKAVTSAAGSPQWSLAQFLADHGVDTTKVVELWTIQNELRAEKLTAAELGKLRFEASSQAKGGVLLGDKLVVANAIALHTRALTPADMPLPEQPDE